MYSMANRLLQEWQISAILGNSEKVDKYGDRAKIVTITTRIIVSRALWYLMAIQSHSFDNTTV